MNLEDKVNQAIKEAMLAKDQAALRGLRAIKSAVLMAKTEKAGAEMDETKELQILQKLLKQRKDSATIYKEQNRDDLLQKEEEEIKTISSFMPEMMDESAVETKIQEIISKLGATDMKDMGKVIGASMKELSGKTDGQTISSIVKRLLSS